MCTRTHLVRSPIMTPWKGLCLKVIATKPPMQQDSAITATRHGLLFSINQHMMSLLHNVNHCLIVSLIAPITSHQRSKGVKRKLQRTDLWYVMKGKENHLQETTPAPRIEGAESPHSSGHGVSRNTTEQRSISSTQGHRL